jgi:hypothetical protein
MGAFIFICVSVLGGFIGHLYQPEIQEQLRNPLVIVGLCLGVALMFCIPSKALN